MPIPGLTEAALDAVAKAVFGHVAKLAVGEALPADKLRAWLGRDPQQLAFQVALVRAYTIFARHHPEWVAFLFDEPFLRGPAAPLLARCLSKGAPPDPAELANAWAEALGPKDEAHARRVKDAMPVATAFLRWLEAELRARPEFQPLFDSDVLNQMAEPAEVTAQAIEALQQELREMSTQAQKYQVTVEQAQGLVIGDRATVTNVFQSFFDSCYASLGEYYLPVDEVFERVRLDDFVGRAWLESDLDEFLGSNDWGTWLLVSAAGIGKTTFLAHLVDERDYVHFFSEQAPGNANLLRALQSIAAQLISRFRLEPYTERKTLPHVLSGYPDFLARLLRLAAGTLSEGERIVLVLDGLDEAGVVEGGNVLGLPRHLPKGVYLVLSQRPQPVALNVEPPVRRVNLDPDGMYNRDDIATYLRRITAIQTISDQLFARKYTVEDFVRILAEKSAGNWMYLHYIVEEIRNGQRASLDLLNLPLGLAGYYAQYWVPWRERSDWDTFYAPLLATLTACFEPLPLPTLKRWSGVQASDYRIQRALREEWRAFVYGLEGAERCYRLYHSSLREFFAGELQSNQFPPSTELLIDEMRERIREAHRRIINDLRESCLGDWPRIVGDSYARRYLSTHLRLAGEHDVLFALTDQRAWYEAQMKADPTGASYLNDVAQALTVAETRDTEAIQRGRKLSLLGREIQCTLANASIRSISKNMPPELLVGLVKATLWTPEQALTVASQNPDQAGLSRSIIALCPYIGSDSDLVAHALDTAQMIASSHYQAEVLAALVPYLPSKQQPVILRQMLEIARFVTSASARTDILIAIAPYLANHADLLSRALEIAHTPIGAPPDTRSMINFVQRAVSQEEHAELLAYKKTTTDSELLWGFAKTLSVLAPYFPSDQHTVLLKQAMGTIGIIESEWYRAEALSFVASSIASSPELLGQALDLARAIQGSDDRAKALTAFIPYLNAEQQALLLDEVLQIVRSIGSAYDRAKALANLVPYLPVKQRRALLSEALRNTQTADKHLNRTIPLIALAPHLADFPDVLMQVLDYSASIDQTLGGSWLAGTLVALTAPLVNHPDLAGRALDTASSIKDAYDRSRALAALSSLLPLEQQCELLEQALDIVHTIGDENARAQALATLLPVLADYPDLLARVASIADSFVSKYNYAQILIAVFPYLTPEQRSSLLDQVIDGFRSCIFGLAYALDRLLPYLTSEQQVDLITQALENTLPHSDPGVFFIDAFKAIAPHLINHPDLLLQVVHTISSSLPEAEIGGGNPRAQAMAVLAPLLPPSQRTDLAAQVLDAASTLPEVSPFRGVSRTELLTHLVPNLANRLDLLTRVLEMTLAIKNVWPRIDMLITLASHLANHPDLLARILDAVCHLPETSPLGQNPRFIALLHLLPHLTGHQHLLAQGLDVVDSFQNADERALSLATLVPYLSGEQKQRLLEQTLIAVRLIKSKSARVTAWINLIPFLQPDQQSGLLVEALSTARSIKDEEARDQILAGLVPLLLLEPPLLTETVEVICSINDVERQNKCFVALTPHLIGYPDLVVRVLDLTRSTQSAVRRVYVLKTFNSLLGNLPRTRLYCEWREVIHLLTESTREDLLSNLTSLSPVLVTLGKAEAAAEVVLAIQNVCRWWP